MTKALSPLDGRYRDKTYSLSLFFSEESILKSKFNLEIDYLKFLNKTLSLGYNEIIFSNIRSGFLESSIINIEKTKTKHDIKAIELYIGESISLWHPAADGLIPFIHFGLTSQDINSLATSNAISSWHKKFGLEILSELINVIDELAARCDIPFPARTHGQFAVQTNLKKEILVFSERLKFQFEKFKNFVFMTKFGGAVGNLSAHYSAYPSINWSEELDAFVYKTYGLTRQKLTTQVDNNDWLAEYFSIWTRINNILIDFCRDIWMYFSYGYFKKRVSAEEVGSSTMPQKVNPIEFENGEGNLEFANSIFGFMSGKLQISRMQRDLTDSTVMRNIGLPFGHSVVAYHSILSGFKKISPNEELIKSEIKDHPELMAEDIQTALRASGNSNAYNLVKDFFMGKSKSPEEVISFIDGLFKSNFISEEQMKFLNSFLVK
jgi:adenylosuccinate lyase